jgi:glycosyltransferase involved in cell wall biosynthesis
MSAPLRIAMLVPDNRDEFRRYDLPQPVFGPAPEALLMGLAELPEVEVHVVACTQRPLTAPERIAPNIFYHSLLVPKLGWLRTGYQGCLRALRHKLRELQPQLVHGQGTERYCALAAVLSGFPNVVTVHGNMRNIARLNRARPFTFAWLAARLEEFTLPRTGGVVCITHYTQEAVRDLVRRTWVLPNAVDPAFFDVQPAPASPPTVLVTGQVCVRKNQNAFIRALDQLAGQLSFKVLFLGGVAEGDPYGAEFKELVAARPWCEYGGFANREQLRGHLREASVLALPSLEDNCPMVVLEAMAASVPVVAARVGGVPDLIDPGRTGLLFDPLNAVSMRESTGALLADSSKRADLLANSRAEALRRFHPRVIAQGHIEIYKAVLKLGNS